MLWLLCTCNAFKVYPVINAVLIFLQKVSNKISNVGFFVITKVINNSGYQFTKLKVNYVAKQGQKIEIYAEFKVCLQTSY